MLKLKSTGAMDPYVFSHFQHFFKQMIPAMGRQIGIRLEPKFRIDNQRDVWFLPLGDVRHADATLSTFDEEYLSLQAADYW